MMFQFINKHICSTIVLGHFVRCLLREMQIKDHVVVIRTRAGPQGYGGHTIINKVLFTRGVWTDKPEDTN